MHIKEKAKLISGRQQQKQLKSGVWHREQAKKKNRQQALKEVTIQRQDIDGTTTTMQKRSYDIEALSLITKKKQVRTGEQEKGKRVRERERKSEGKENFTCMMQIFNANSCANKCTAQVILRTQIVQFSRLCCCFFLFI